VLGAGPGAGGRRADRVTENGGEGLQRATSGVTVLSGGGLRRSWLVSA
jgi:hypothetical protein